LTPPFDGDPYEQLPASRSVSPEPSLQRRRLTLQRVPTPPHDPRPVPPGAAPTVPPKMHQTSSRLLRMTEDERPFTKVGYLLACPGTGNTPRRRADSEHERHERKFGTETKGKRGVYRRLTISLCRISWTCSPP
jgi:hypothetical protein